MAATTLAPFFRRFPLHTRPAVSRDSTVSTRPTLWIAPPTPDIVVPSTNLLSADVECLKWQAYIALRDVRTELAVRWDIDPEGAVDGRLPTLFVPPGDVLGPRLIPGWVDDVLGKAEQDAFEGYRDEAAKDESRAWVAVLEGIVHVALVSLPSAFQNGRANLTLQTLATPKPLSLTSLLLHFPAQSKSHSLPNAASVASHLSPPPAPLSGIASLFPPYGERISSTAVQSQYHDAIVALSDRLGADQWFLASPYVSILLQSTVANFSSVARRHWTLSSSPTSTASSRVQMMSVLMSSAAKILSPGNDASASSSSLPLSSHS